MNQKTVSRIKIICSDKYDATKLTSIIFVPGKSRTFIKDVLNVYGNEVIVSLQDKSAHSITLQDDSQAENLVDLIQSTFESMNKIIDVIAINNTIEITIETAKENSS
jgi:hypothetical protein